ncbi:hypothetical protein BS78_06G226800 [Paspalum vaginatum]|nr:hypothetical protein BS78_06G226800 [Paspalum vaginatum]
MALPSFPFLLLLGSNRPRASLRPCSSLLLSLPTAPHLAATLPWRLPSFLLLSPPWRCPPLSSTSGHLFLALLPALPMPLPSLRSPSMGGSSSSKAAGQPCLPSTQLVPPLLPASCPSSKNAEAVTGLVLSSE